MSEDLVSQIPNRSYSDVHAVFQKPVKFISNHWGQDIRVDKSKVDINLETEFWPQARPTSAKSIQGSLPYTTSPRLRKHVPDRIMPTWSRLDFSRACWNECVNQAGPWYLRRAPIWDYVSFLPTGGDVSLDPRYGADTKKFTSSYRLHRDGVQLPRCEYGIGGRNVPL